MSDAAKVNDSPPKPAFVVVVCGSATAPAAFVHRKLTELTAARRETHTVCVMVGAGEDAASSWADAREQRHPVYFEPLLVELYGRRYAPVRWAMKVVAEAAAVVIFGDPAKWWRVVRYAEQAGVPVRRIAPSLCARPPPPEIQGKRVPSAFKPAPNCAQYLFDGDGPLGLPH